MKVNKGIMVFIVIATCINSTAMSKKNQRKVRRNAERIISGDRISNLAKEQTRLIQSLTDSDAMESEPTFPNDLSLFISALAKKNTFPALAQHEETLHKAAELFADVPGFKELFKHIVRVSARPDDAHMRGSLYELEVALAISKRDDEEDDEEVVEFGKKIIDPQNGQIKRKIDVVKQKKDGSVCWIECKDRSPHAKQLHALKAQVKSQQKYAHEADKEYEVHFKQGINEKLAAWFDRNKISYVVDTITP